MQVILDFSFARPGSAPILGGKKSEFRDWTSSEVISQVLFTSEQPTKIKVAFVGVIVTNAVALWAANYSACVVYTKTIIHLSVGESGHFGESRHFGE